jgi:hypothetical protein
MNLINRSLVIGLLVTGWTSAHAAGETGIEFSGSGFLTLGVGKILGGTDKNYNEFNCPCFVSDYAQGGMFEDRGLNWKPDTKLGLQGALTFGHNLSVTGQVVARGARDGKANLEWLYADYKINDHFNVQVGRKRIPQFYYSDTQDVGFALPWTHLPPQNYGWEAVNYNGVNLSYRDNWAGWATALNVLAGSEHYKDSGYWKVYFGKNSKTDIRWDNIRGGDLTLSKGWLETRLVYIQSDRQIKNRTGVWDPALGSYDPATADVDFIPSPRAKQKIYGVALNADYDHWIVRTEFIHIDHPGDTFKDFAQMIGVGYRIGKWQPMVTWSNYFATAQVENGGTSGFDEEAHRALILTLRYDIDTSSALKVQIDDQKDRSQAGSLYQYGNARLLSITYDKVF